jgi:hypothetical protein
MHCREARGCQQTPFVPTEGAGLTITCVRRGGRVPGTSNWVSNLGRVQNAPRGRRDRHSLAVLAFARPNRSLRRVDLHPRNRRRLAAGTWNRETNHIRDDVAQVQQFKSALVRDHRSFLPYGEPGRQHVLPGRRWIFPETVEPVPNMDEPTSFRVVRDERGHPLATSGGFLPKLVGDG